MALSRIELRLGGMTDRKDVQLLTQVLNGFAGIDAQDVRQGLIRLEYDPKVLDLNRLLAALAEAGEGYDVAMA